MAPCAHYHPIPANGRGSTQPPPPTSQEVNPACPPGEPPMNRYPHPVVTQYPPSQTADFHVLHCTLAYQNQLLADIKALLQALVQQGESD